MAAAKKPVQKKSPAKKVSKKVAQKRQVKPKLTDEMFLEYFLKCSAADFQMFIERWNEKNLKVTLKKQLDYDGWLNYFKTLPVRKLQLLVVTGIDILPAEAYSALLRWKDITENPHRIDKIHQAGLTKPKADKNVKGIVELAFDNDRLGVLKATRDAIAEKLAKGAGARDTAALARELTEVMTQIQDYEKRLGPKKETKLGQLLDDMHDVKDKRPSENGKGARHTSFRSRVTIEDVEGK